MGSTPPAFRLGAFLIAAVVVELAVVVPGLRANPTGYLPGDAGLYAAACHSLVFDGDLDLLNQCRPGFATLADALPELQGPLGGEFALSADGKLTLKQSPVLSLAAVPFYAVLGLPGLLLFNLTVTTLLLRALAKLVGDTSVARVVVLLGFAVGPVRRYAFNFSPDLVLCGLLVGGLLAARGNRPFVAGLAAGLAVSVKLYAAAILLPVVVFAAAVGRTWAAIGLLVLGGAAGLVPGAAVNAWQFGKPWVTGYERELKVEGDRVGLADHSSRFTVPVGQGLRDLAAHPTLGLWPTVPWWFAWPVAAGVLLARRDAPGGRGWVAATVAVIAVTLGLFARYDGALFGSTDANRYLFPAVFGGLALIAAALSVRLARPARPDV